MTIIYMALINRSIDKWGKCMEKSQTEIEGQAKKKIGNNLSNKMQLFSSKICHFLKNRIDYPLLMR